MGDAVANINVQILVLVLTFLTFRPAHGASQSKCMGMFGKDRSAFDICKTVPCLMFKSEEPYIFVSDSFTRRPFRCGQRFVQFKNPPDGQFFDLVQQIPVLEDPYCVHSGPECSFDEQVEFLKYAHEAGEGHQFIVAGLMWILSYRIHNYSIPSVPFSNGGILVLGPLASPVLSVGNAWNAVFGPFEPNAWALVFLLVSIFLLLRCGISLCFTKPLSLKVFCWNTLGEYKAAEQYVRVQKINRDADDEFALEYDNETDDMDEDEDGEQNNASNDKLNSEEIARNRSALKFYNKYWMMGFKAFILLTILFYELALFAHVFALLQRSPSKSMRGLPKSELRKFAVLKGAAQEYLFRLTVDPDGKYENTTPPWGQFVNVKDVYDALLEGGRFALSYEHVLGHQIDTQGVCDKLTLYKTDAKTKFYQGGWYFSVDVPLPIRIQVDNSFSLFVEQGIIDRLLKHEENSDVDQCGRSRPRISFTILFLPLIPMTLSIMLLVVVRILVGFVYQVVLPRLRGPNIATRYNKSGDLVIVGIVRDEFS